MTMDVRRGHELGIEPAQAKAAEGGVLGVESPVRPRHRVGRRFTLLTDLAEA
jgi:hypothetical protein